MNKPNNNTKAKLDQVLIEINKATNSPEFPWTTSEGKAIPNKGNFHSEYIPDKGYAIHRFGEVTSEGVQILEPIFSGQMPIRATVNAAQAFLNGLSFQK